MNFKIIMKTFFKIVGFIAAVLAFILFFRWMSNKGTKKVKIGAGSAPTQADKNCASGGNAGDKIIGSCTKPMIYPLPPRWKEKCFSSDELGLQEGDQGYSVVTDNNGFGTKWFFNYQSGDRFCYTNNDPSIIK